jgi:hypothetical protein
MALLEDQIEEAQAALIAAHDAKDVEGAQVLADHIRELQAQKDTVDKAALESSKEGTNLTNPLIAGGVGAVAGAAVNPARGAIHDIITPVAAAPKISTPHPSTLTPQNPTISSNRTPYNPRGSSVEESIANWNNYADAQTQAAKGVRRDTALLKKYPNMQLGPAGSASTPSPTLPPPAPPTMAQKGKNLLGSFVADHQPNSPFSIVKGGARGAVTGASLADVPQQIEQGNYGTAATDVGIGAGNILHGLARTPKLKAIGTLLGVGSGAARAVEGVNELMPEQKAEGGLVHMAGGGVANALTQTAINAPFIAPTATGIAKNVGKGAYVPAIEDAASLGLAMAPLNPLTVGLSLMAPGEAGRGSTLDDLYKRRADEQAAIKRAQKQFEHEQFMQNQVGANAPKFLEDYQAKKMAGGGKAVLDLAKKASGYLHHTPVNPNPLVGTRFETKDLGGLAPIKDISLEDIRDHMLQTKPWDTSSRNKQIVSVSGKPITADIVTHGGQSYPRDLEHIKQEIGGASALPITNRIQNITNIASHEGEKLGGTGQVSMTPSSMSKFSEDYAVPTFDTYKNLWDQAEPGAARTQALLEKLRFASPKTLKTETPIPFAGMVKDVKYPFQDLKSLDFNDPDVAGRFMQTPDLRKALIKEWRSKENQKMMGYNAEDLSAAHTDPNLMGVPAGYAGHTMIEMKPGATPTLSSNITYDTDFGGNYLGSIGHTPTAVLLNKSYSKINNEMRQLHPDANEDALHRLTLGALYTRNHGVSDLVNDEMINRVGAYHEGVKQNKIDPNDVQGALQYLSKPGAYNEGGQVESFALGGKVGAAKKLFEEAQAAYKAKFTPDFYHASPSNKIKAFDTQAERNPNFLTALEEESNDLAPRGFVSLTKNPKFANDYATGKNATVYPVSANLGKHLDPRLPENYDVFHQYWKGNPESFPNYYGASHTLPKSYREAEWSVMEDPGFLEHLKNKGYNSMTMVENGQPNVGVFNPADIRGKFAKFNPEDAASPDFMKAEGGSVEGYAPGGSVLSKMGAIAKDLSLPAAENAARTQIIGTLPTYGKAADMLAQRGATGQAIDFGAGLGKGAELLGPGTHTYEPFAQNWNPTYSNAKDIPSDAYGRLTNLNVLNVVPREARDEIVQNIGRVIEPGGQGIITTRGADVMKAQGRPGPEPTSVITSRDTYQKGFSKQELEEYLKYMLGQKFDINKINLGPAGVHIQKKAEGGLAQSFNPQGEDYDYQTALAHGMGPTGLGDNQGHWGSVAPVSDDEQQLHDLPSNSYVVLKGKSHPTFYKAENAENERGSEIVKKGDRYYSVPKK